MSGDDLVRRRERLNVTEPFPAGCDFAPVLGAELRRRFGQVTLGRPLGHRNGVVFPVAFESSVPDTAAGQLVEEMELVANELARTLRIRGEDIALSRVMEDRMDVRTAKDNRTGIKLFISHSEHDKGIALALVTWLEGCIAFPQDRTVIRCTSLPDYTYDLGDDQDALIRDEVVAADYAIVILTDNAVKSSWVLFEMGARWSRKDARLAPLIHPRATFAIIPDVISKKRGVKLDNLLEMANLPQQVSSATGFALKKQSSISRATDEFQAFVGRLADQVEEPATAIAAHIEDRVRKALRSANSGGSPSQHAAEVAKCGPRSEVLPLVLLEQERFVRDRLPGTIETRVMGEMGIRRPFDRKQLENLQRTVVEYLEREGAAAIDAIVDFGATLFHKGTIKGTVYERELQEQAYLLASEIEGAYGHSAGRIVDRFIPNFEGRTNALHDLWIRTAGRPVQFDPAVQSVVAPRSVDSPIAIGARLYVVVPYGGYSHATFIVGARWEGENLLGVCSANRAGTLKLGSHATGRVLLGLVQARGGEWTWAAYHPPAGEVVERGTEASPVDARLRVLVALSRVIPEIDRLGVSTRSDV